MDASFADALPGAESSEMEAMRLQLAEMQKKLDESENLEPHRQPSYLKKILDAEGSAESISRLCDVARFMRDSGRASARTIGFELYLELLANKRTWRWTKTNEENIRKLSLNGFCDLVEEAWANTGPDSPEITGITNIAKRPNESYRGFVLRYAAMYCTLQAGSLALKGSGTESLEEIARKCEDVGARMLLTKLPPNALPVIPKYLTFKELTVIAGRVDAAGYTHAMAPAPQPARGDVVMTDAFALQNRFNANRRREQEESDTKKLHKLQGLLRDRCYNCFKIGHFKKQCPLRGKMQAYEANAYVEASGPDMHFLPSTEN